ncbi:hypothetical protein SAMN05518855_10362 [Paenibacillus sp. CF384]|nr:hypothetical protein SAMN05518855_10362 [Paenibacillus sp. CF384]
MNSLVSSFKKLALRNVNFAIYNHLTGRSLFSFQRTNTCLLISFISFRLMTGIRSYHDSKHDCKLYFSTCFCLDHRFQVDVSEAEIEYIMVR